MNPEVRSSRGRYRIITGLAATLLRSLIVLGLCFLALRRSSSLKLAQQAVRGLRRRRQSYFGGTKLKKLIGFRHKLFSGLNIPGWPSRAFDVLIRKELHRPLPGSPVGPYLRTLIFGITTKCTLSCRHCYAGAVLNRPEALSLEELRTIVARFQRLGLSHLQLSGGEPLCRFEELLALARGAKPGTDVWVLSSGIGLTPRRAREMEKAGITGVNISLDHWLPGPHNAFRGSDSSFDWALQAIRNARSHGLLVAVTLCATPGFVEEGNLWSYAAFVRTLGVAFIQILEARAVGHLAGTDVRLDADRLAILDAFYRAANGARRHRSLPIVVYHGYWQRRFGCRGAGDDFLYVDPLGAIYPCPFSESRLGNALTDDLERLLGGTNRRCACDRYVLARS